MVQHLIPAGLQAAKDGPWLDVPPDNILRRENLLGDALAGRCFIPPNET